MVTLRIERNHEPRAARIDAPGFVALVMGVYAGPRGIARFG